MELDIDSDQSINEAFFKYDQEVKHINPLHNIHEKSYNKHITALNL